MKCLIADDEPIILNDIHRIAKKCIGGGCDTEFYLAKNSDEALSIIEKENETGAGIQIAFLDIEMPYVSGLEVAKRIQEISPKTNIIFVTAHERYAIDVLNLYVSGFIFKPVSESSMQRAVDNLRFPIARLRARCFGYFEVFYDNVPVKFKRSQSKEIFAYLIDKRGAFVPEDELRYLLWTEEEDSEKKRKYVRNIISDIRMTFKNYGVENIIINNNKSGYCVNKEKINCDLFDYIKEGMEISKQEQKIYMEQYPWAKL